MFASLAVGDSEFVNEGHRIVSNVMQLYPFKSTTKEGNNINLESQFSLRPIFKRKKMKCVYLRKFHDDCNIQVVC